MKRFIKIFTVIFFISSQILAMEKEFALNDNSENKTNKNNIIKDLYFVSEPEIYAKYKLTGKFSLLDEEQEKLQNSIQEKEKIIKANLIPIPQGLINASSIIKNMTDNQYKLVKLKNTNIIPLNLNEKLIQALADFYRTDNLALKDKLEEKNDNLKGLFEKILDEIINIFSDKAKTREEIIRDLNIEEQVELYRFADAYLNINLEELALSITRCLATYLSTNPKGIDFIESMLKEDTATIQAKIGIAKKLFLHFGPIYPNGKRFLDIGLKSDNKIYRDYGFSIKELLKYNKIKLKDTIRIIPTYERYSFKCKALELTGLKINDIKDLELINSQINLEQTNIIKIDLENNLIGKIFTNSFENFENLQRLRLNNNYIDEIEAGSFYKLSGLDDLQLAKNRIDKLDSNIFRNLTNLKYLSIKDNRLNKLNFLNNLAKLKLLNLDNNNIEDIQDNSFEDLKSLDMLALSQNKLTLLKPKYFNRIGNLKYLYLLNNNIRKIEKDSLLLPKLNFLSLASNKLYKLKPNHLNHLPNLTTLNLNDNEIDKLEPNIFANMPNLITLNLSGNRLTHLCEDTFNGLGKLTNLEIHKNRIDCLENNCFRGLTELKILSLEHNKIQNLKPYSFNNLHNLRKLFLQHNLLFNIDDLAFNGLVELRDLNLQHNKLVNLSLTLLSELKNLKLLTVDSLVFNQDDRLFFFKNGIHVVDIRLY